MASTLRWRPLARLLNLPRTYRMWIPRCNALMLRIVTLCTSVSRRPISGRWRSRRSAVMRREHTQRRHHHALSLRWIHEASAPAMAHCPFPGRALQSNDMPHA